MSQNNTLLSLLAVIIAMFGSLVVYDVIVNHRLEKILGNESNWHWKDNWKPDAAVDPVAPVAPVVPIVPVVPANPQPPKNQTPQGQINASNYQDAVKKSGELGMPILIMFEADWCHWCKEMEQKTLTDNQVKNMLLNYIFVTVNADNEGVTTKKFGVSGLPSYAISNCKEEKLKFGSGYKSAKEFTVWLNDPSLFKQPKSEISPPESKPIDKNPNRRKPRFEDPFLPTPGMP